MKRILLLISFLLVFIPFGVFAQDTGTDPVGVLNLLIDLSSIAGVVAIVLPLTGWLKTLFKLEGKSARWISWVVSVIVSLIGSFLNMGLFAEMVWYIAILWGIGIGLVANGVFTAETVKLFLIAIKAQLSKK